MRAFVLSLVLTAACAGTTAPTQPAHSQGPVEIREDLAPVPFPPGTLATSLRPGATITFRMEQPGQTPYLLTTEFVDVDETGTTMRDTQAELDGTPRGEPATAEATWEELESHAHFPRDATTITEEEIEVPVGRVAAYRYEITASRDGVPTTTRLWFAKPLPGPPVKVVREVDGEVVLEMTMVETHRP